MKRFKQIILSVVSIFTFGAVFGGFAPAQTSAAGEYTFEMTGTDKVTERGAYTGEIRLAGSAGSIKPTGLIEVELPEFLSCGVNASTFNTTNSDFIKLKSITGTTTKKVTFSIDTIVTANGAFDARIPFAITVCDNDTLKKGDADLAQTIKTNLISEGKVIDSKTKNFTVSPIHFGDTKRPIHKFTQGSYIGVDPLDPSIPVRTFSSFDVPVRNDLKINLNTSADNTLKPLENVVVTDTLAVGQTLANVPASVVAPNKDKKVLLQKKGADGKYVYVSNFELVTTATGFTVKILNDTAEENEYVVQYWTNQTTLKPQYKNEAKVEASNLSALVNQYYSNKDGKSYTIIKPAPITSGGAEIRKTVDRTLVEATDANQKVNYTINMLAKLAYDKDQLILEDTINSDLQIDSIDYDKTKLRLEQNGNTIKFFAITPINAGDKLVFNIKTDFTKVASGKIIPNTAKYLGLFNTNTVNTLKRAPEYMKIQGTTFEDANKNNIIDSGEAKLSNVEVKLYEVDSNAATPTKTLIKTVKTDANGLYDFGQVRAFFAQENKKYVVERSDVAGYTFFNGNGPNFKFAGIDKFSTDVASISNSTQIGNIGYIKNPSSKIGDTVYEDTNRNGKQDLGEKGIANVTLGLWKVDGQRSFVKAVRTDANGKYLFSEVVPGTYQVRVIKPFEMAETTNLLGDIKKDSLGKDYQDTKIAYKVDGTNSNLDIDFGFVKEINDPLTNTIQIENKNKDDDAKNEPVVNPEQPIIVK